MATSAIPPWTPPLKLRVFLVVWRLAWLVLMPVILCYLLLRGRREPLYRQRIAQRFGFHGKRATPHIWVHAVSIGELRSAVPLIRAFLARGERIVTTHFTPAGLAEAERIFADDIAASTLSAVYVPFDYGLTFRRFFRAFRPRLGLVMEVEFWPGMIMASRRAGVPLFLCNGQYPANSFARDKNRFLSPANLTPGFAGVMVKSDVQAVRFRSLGQSRIAITGEMRFEQPIPPEHLSAAARARPALAGARPVITLASVVEAEETLFIDAMKQTLAKGADRPFFVFVPRSPARFDRVSQMIADAGLSAARRSEILDTTLTLTNAPNAQILIGDSLGEMYFYLALCDTAVTGGGFNPAGSHNIIEPLALRKPVIVGPELWTIEYPAVEALEAGVAHQVEAEKLAETLCAPPQSDPVQIDKFLSEHAGAVDKTLRALDEWLA